MSVWFHRVLGDALHARQESIHGDRWPEGSVSDALATSGVVRLFWWSVAAEATVGLFRFEH